MGPEECGLGGERVGRVDDEPTDGARRDLCANERKEGQAFSVLPHLSTESGLRQTGDHNSLTVSQSQYDRYLRQIYGGC